MKKIRLSESQLRQVVRDSVYDILNEGFLGNLKGKVNGFLDSIDNTKDSASVSDNMFNKGLIAKCMIDYDGMETEPRYIGLGAGDYGEDDVIYVANNMGEFDALRKPRNGKGFFIKSVVGIEEA